MNLELHIEETIQDNNWVRFLTIPQEITVEDCFIYSVYKRSLLKNNFNKQRSQLMIYEAK